MHRRGHRTKVAARRKCGVGAGEDDSSKPRLAGQLPEMIEQLDRHRAVQWIKGFRLVHSHDGVAVPPLDGYELTLPAPGPGYEFAVAARRLLCGLSHPLLTPSRLIASFMTDVDWSPPGAQPGRVTAGGGS